MGRKIIKPIYNEDLRRKSHQLTLKKFVKNKATQYAKDEDTTLSYLIEDLLIKELNLVFPENKK